LKKALVHFFKKKQRSILTFFRSVLKSRWLITFLIILVLAVTTIGIVNNVYVYYMKKNYVNLFEMKLLIVSYIKENMKKAVEMGVVDFNLFEGVTFEDIRISSEEDFSNNKVFFYTQRLDLRFSTIFKKNVSIEKVIFHNTRIEVESSFSISEFIEYIKASNLPSLEFRNLTIIKKLDGKIVWQTNRPIHLNLVKKKEKYTIQLDDSYFYMNFSAQMLGQGQLDLEKKHLFILLQLDGIPLEKFSGVIEELTYIQPDSGTLAGFIKLEESLWETNMDGNLNLYSVTGKFQNIRISSIPLNCKFSYYKEVEDQKEEIYFQRKINNPNFYLNQNYHKSKDAGGKLMVSGLFQDLEKLSSAMDFDENTKLSGNLKIDFSIEDQIKGPELFKIEGLFVGEKFGIQRNKPALDLRVDNGGFRINSNGNFESNLELEIFGKKGSLSGSGIVQFLKVNDENYNFSLNSNTIFNLKLDEIIFSDFRDIYESIQNSVEEDIRERQEKMLPESYIVRTPFYKQYLERTGLQIKFQSQSFKNEPNGKELGPMVLDFRYLRSSLDLEILSKSENPFFQLFLKGMLDKKMPYWDLRLKLNEFPWNKKYTSYCGYDFIPESLNLNLAVQSTGNNFSDFTGRKSYSLFFELLRTNFKSNIENPKLEGFDELFQNTNVNIKGGWAGFGLDGYFRDLEIYSEVLSYKGFGNVSKSGSHAFNFWGTNDGKYSSWNLTRQEGNKCLYSKK
jgi:hypothetical protein